MKIESSEVQTYFFVQGQSIKKVWDILNSNLLMHQVQKGLSIFIEVLLYIALFILLMIITLIPNNPLEFTQQYNEYTSVTTEIKIQQLIDLMLFCKFILFVFSLPIIGMAVLLRRNRKKRTLIRAAFEEVEQMKNRYDDEFAKLSITNDNKQ